MATLPRRDFLKAAPAVVGALTSVPGQAAAHASATTRTPAWPRISSVRHAPGDYPIQPVRFSAVRLTDGFWKPKVERNATVTIPFQISKYGESGRGLNGNTLEAAIHSLEVRPDPELQAKVEARIRALVAQPPALSNSGFEIAVAWYNATGRRELLDRAIACAELLYQDFRANDPPFNGGERDAINCLQLYRATGNPKHLDLAKHYLDIRGRGDSVNRSRHNQSYKPVLEQSEAVGHAVNCVTLMVSMVDVGMLTGIRDYSDAAQRMWQDVVRGKLYITGGVGQTGNEGFGEAFWLPNINAYCETCAVLMFMTLNHRLFLATGDSQYIDVLERGMYNNALSGVSVSGDRFFYVNRLASAGVGRDHRWQRASLECCPPNLVRFLASMPGYIHAQDGKGSIWVNLYVSSETSFQIGGKTLGLAMESEMPWGGRSVIRVSSAEPLRATIRLRIPGWALDRPAPDGLYTYIERSSEAPRVAVNGSAVRAVPDAHGYVGLDREWRSGDVITVEFPMTVRRVAADARVREARGSIAIERGPIVYCCEWPEVGGGRVFDLQFDASAEFRPSHDNAFLGGATVIDTVAGTMRDPSVPKRPVRLIPYHLWANRGTGEMTVWLRTDPYRVGDIGPAGGWIFYENPNYRTDGWRWLEAAPFDQSLGAKWGCFRNLIPGARGAEVGTGRQNTADILAACREPGSAADLSASLSVNGVRGWFLPSRDELALMYRNLKAAGLGDFSDHGKVDNVCYWTSTQYSADMAGHVDFADLGRLHYDDKDFPRRVRAIRAV